MLIELITTFLIIVALFIFYIKWKYIYWRRKGVPYIEPHFPYGNSQNPITRTTPPNIEIKNLYRYFKEKGAEHCGIYLYTTPVYMPIDLGHVKSILQSDFKHFIQRGRYYDEKGDPVSAHLFNINGELWKILRPKLTPTFTAAKLRLMVPAMIKSGENLIKAIAECLPNNEPLNVQEFSWRYTADAIVACVYGIEIDSFFEEESPYVKYGKNLDPTSVVAIAQLSFAYSFPDMARFLGIKRFDKATSSFFINAVTQIVKHREENNIKKNDFLQILIGLKNLENKEEALTMNQLIAQCVVFFGGGFDTSTTVITFLLYELAENQDIQKKVRNEINEVLRKHNGEITYDTLKDLYYMQQVFDETVRKYPPVPFLHRECVIPYKIPNTNVVLDKGTQLIIPSIGLHYDPDYYPEPEKFDPDRFSIHNRQLINPYSFLPFGEGPRNCIGGRFGLVQVKAALCMLLKEYSFSVSSKTKTPIEYKNNFITCPKYPIWLLAAKVNDS